jgi:riboflavin kinase/FMN adenylyltransferase
MRIYRHFPDQALLPSALAIGNFDGMHLGHQALLTSLVEKAKASNLTPAVMTFEPHPREFFTPLNAPARLCNLREKLEYFKAAGIQQTFICKFNQRFAAMSAEAFIAELRALNVSAILVGEDFRFGAKRQGSTADFTHHGFNLIAMPRVDFNSERISSTRVRDALFSGNLSLASALLGRHYSISGKVVHGAKRGRQLGFPTANVHMRHERPALTGVYAVKLDGLPAVANLGVRPTIAGIPKLMLEVHVLDFVGNLYDSHVHVQFLHKIRDEMKFGGLDALKAQIGKDVEVAKQFFKTQK